MNKQLPFRFIIQFDCLRNGVIILSCMTRMLRSYSALLGKNDNLAIVDTLLSFFGIIGTLLKASILTDSVVPCPVISQRIGVRDYTFIDMWTTQTLF